MNAEFFGPDSTVSQQGQTLDASMQEVDSSTVLGGGDEDAILMRLKIHWNRGQTGEWC